MRKSFIKIVFRATFQLTFMLTSTGVSANDYMEYANVDSEQIAYETKANNDHHLPYKDPNFHNDSYQLEQASEETVISY